MTPMSKIAVAILTLSVGGASAAYALGPMSQSPQTGVGVIEKAHFDGRRGWGRDGDRGPRGPHGRGGGPRGPHGMMMMEIFRQADADGDGKLSQEELDAFIAGQVSEANTDGTDGVTLEEFEIIWLNLTNRAMVRTFQFMDTDGDAVISQEEIDERFGKVVERFDRNGDGFIDKADRKGRGMHHGDRRGRGGHRGPQEGAGPDGADGPDGDDD